MIDHVALDQIRLRLQVVFAGAEVSPPSVDAPFCSFDWEGPNSALQGCLTSESPIVSAHGFSEEGMNRLIDVLRELDAPQVGERFDGVDCG